MAELRYSLRDFSEIWRLHWGYDAQGGGRELYQAEIPSEHGNRDIKNCIYG